MIECKKWRMNNLYRIIDRNSNSIPFKLNWVQEHVLEHIHTRNLILKARQLGMSTFAVLYLLDEVLFNRNLGSGIVSYSLEHAQHIFKRIIGHAIDTFPRKLAPLVGINQRSARELLLSNGSTIRVDTTLRGGSYPLILVSEFGKTCARNPLKAEEVITGTLQAVPANGRVIIESTGEGNEGHFADMVTSAARHQNQDLSDLDYKLFFYPWYQELSYVLDGNIPSETQTTEYFSKIERDQGVTLSKEQKNWYIKQRTILGDKIGQEFPSTIGEAFLSSSDAFYFAEGVQKAYDTHRCLNSPLFDALLPVYVAMDIGLNDLTVIVFFQVAHGEVRVIDYYEDKNKGVDFYARFLLQDKPYHYNTIFLPHDSVKRDPLDVENSYEREFKRLFSSTSCKFHVLAKMDKQLSISRAKITLDRCVFNLSKVKPFIDKLSKYRKKWNEALGKYMEEPLHNIASNHADAFQYACQAVGHIEKIGDSHGSLEKHRQIVEARNRRFY